MAIPTALESLSTTAASNGPSGSDDRSTADDGLRQAYAFIKQLVSLGSNIASATTITPPSTGSVFNITGTTTITTIASTNSWDGRIITLIFAGALTFTHSSNLKLPGSNNITTAANDVALMVQTASGAWLCAQYIRAAGDAVFVSTSTSGPAIRLVNTGSSIAAVNETLGTIEFYSNDASANSSGVFGRIGTYNEFSGSWDGTASRVDTYMSFWTSADGVMSEVLRLQSDKSMRQATLTVAGLASATTAGAGSRSFVTDATATTFASIVAGGGANNVPVYSDGTNWRIG